MTLKSASGQGYLNRWLTEENIAGPALLDAIVSAMAEAAMAELMLVEMLSEALGDER
jgi:hypothetical protein